jgi:hypothetical protein
MHGFLLRASEERNYRMYEGDTTMKKRRYMLRFIVALTLTNYFLVVPGCSKSASEPDSKSAEVGELIKQVAALQVRRPDGIIKTITLAEALHRPHNDKHEHHATAQNTDSPQTEHQHQELCLGVVTGYAAIRYAVDGLFPNEIPEANDFDIMAVGPMDGAWDVFELYTGRELSRYQTQEALNLKSFTFVAKRISTDKRITFRLCNGLIPETFFELKKQGATCSDPTLKKIKEQGTINILSTGPNNCFQTVDVFSGQNEQNR